MASMAAPIAPAMSELGCDHFFQGAEPRPDAEGARENLFVTEFVRGAEVGFERDGLEGFFAGLRAFARVGARGTLGNVEAARERLGVELEDDDIGDRADETRRRIPPERRGVDRA